MSCRSICWLICMSMTVSLATLYKDPDSTKEWPVTESVREAMLKVGEELGTLLDTGEGAVVTVEAGATRLLAHRAVLAARCPVIAAMLRHNSMEADSQLSVPHVEGAVLRHLVAYLYTLQAPQLPPGMATQMLVAAHSFGLPALQADCERQVAAHLSVDTAASIAVLAVEHSLTDLRDSAVNFIKEHHIKVLATKGWSDALENHPKEAAELSHLLDDRLAETCAMVTTEAGATITMESEATTITEAPITTTIQSYSDPSQSPTTAAPPHAACPTSRLDEDTISSLQKLSAEERVRRLFEAAKKGAVQELRALLAAGAEVGARNKKGATALHFASVNGHVEAAKCLLEDGAQVDARNDVQWTPLYWAALVGREAVVRLLLAASADPNARDKWGLTPLHMAAWQDHVPLVPLLLAASANHNARDEDGDTPLHLAAMFDRSQVVAALLEGGADSKARNNEGRTPLNYAMTKNQKQIIDMLTQH